jgi:hypothetical protein
VTVSAAQPAPQESTLPTPYVTPGLGQGASSSPAAAYDGAIDPKAQTVFTPHGAVYGAAPGASLVTLQAKKSVSIVIRAPDQKVVYAGVLKPGEAYRAPSAGGLSADVSDPQDIDVYVGGQIHAGLTAQVTPLSKLAADASPAAPAATAASPSSTAATSTPAKTPAASASPAN